MIINSLKLKNIRSYGDEEIKFSEGSIMLSGDIGTGKTTILLGIEFALFGIIRGEISGTALLRHGKKEGSVELDFNVEDKNVIIKRSLKRSIKSVAQKSGSITMNGVEEELTPVELKSKILELIGYPDELLTKSKNLIYRYTVYTPQEEMKQILYESVDERLNILRRIFDIDKYKRIRENTLNFLKILKIKKTELETRIEDLENKKNELEEYKNQVKKIDTNKKNVVNNILIIGKELNEKEKIIIKFEDQIKEIEKINNQLMINKSKIDSEKKEILKDKQEVEELKEKISFLEKEFLNQEKTDNKLDSLEDLEQKKQLLEENLNKIISREATFKAMKNNSKDIVDKITALDECPVCQQKVDSDYKKKVHLKEHENIENILLQLQKLEELKLKRKTDIEELNAKIKIAQETIRKQELIQLKKKQLEEYKERKEKILSEKKNFEGKISQLEKEIIELKNKLEKQPQIQEDYKKAKLEIEEIKYKQKKEEIRLAELEQEKRTIEQIQLKLQEEINKKLESKKELQKVNDTSNWLSKYFLNIIYLMEKQIMLRIHQEFNEYFQEWFNILIEDENLNVRLDEMFTPIIEQNGYETFIENLSGGEKTSVALAYRLALNKVINDFMGTIKTKDLLILDEPTDGFSSEQLDKIRELLEQINVKQIILVSHEPKLESYVDHIIRIAKSEHQSRVIS